MRPLPFADAAYQGYQQQRIAHWDHVACTKHARRDAARWYHRRLQTIYGFLVSRGQRILEIGCGTGDLLASLPFGDALGVDFSSGMLDSARLERPELKLVQADAHDLSCIQGSFDIIILSDTVNELWDVQQVLEEIRRLCIPSTRLIINFHSGLWRLPLAITRALHLAMPTLAQNWLTQEDIRGMLNLAGFEYVRGWQEVLWPLPWGGLANKLIVRFWPFKEFALSNFIIARPQMSPASQEPSVSIIIPARNESGNIRAIFERTPQMGRATELVFVEGHSRDDTYAAIEREIASHPSVHARLMRQAGIGKADAVRLGFQQAQGDILMILDADLTVPPEDLTRFYDALSSGKGEFVNGVRLVYPMEKDAMRGLNFIGNKLFSMAFSWILGQPIKDTLCGTKALWRTDYAQIADNRSYFGEFDPFGDYDLIFGAAKLNRKIVDLPIRYRERTYGSTNISRWKHGWLLVRMVWFAAWRLKFI